MVWLQENRREIVYGTAIGIIMQTQQHPQKTNTIFDKSFLIICGFYLASFWFFSFWVLKNNGRIWVGPLGIGHHPFNLELFNTHFMETITYLFIQSPFYSVVTWLMLENKSGRWWVLCVSGLALCHGFLHWFCYTKYSCICRLKMAEYFGAFLFCF